MTPEQKHTAGPWFISKKYVVGPRDESDSQGFGMIIGVADVYGDNRNQDARLIAAAPDMLAALQWAEAALAPFSKDPAEKSGMALIRNAIAKAVSP